MSGRVAPAIPRKIEPRPATCADVPAQDADDVKAWLKARATENQLRWLLAHADDGIIWGRIQDDGQLLTSHEAAQRDAEAKEVCPPLRSQTLQQARLFAEHAELLLWRDGDSGWHARLIADVVEGGTGSAAAWTDAFDEPQLMWGTQGRALVGGFTLMEDGMQGLRHAVPVAVPLGPDGAAVPPRLIVRHYLNREGFARVVASRLVGLEYGGDR